MVERVPTGISGFDELVDGGFPRGSSILVCGSPGTGKTLFATEFLYRGATRYNERGLYLSFEQKHDDIVSQGKPFGWDLAQLEREGKMEILSIPVRRLNDGIVKEIMDKVRNGGFKRVVVDSLTTLAVNAPVYDNMKEMSVKDVLGENTYLSAPVIGDFIVKRFIYMFLEELRETTVTSLLISEAGDPKEGYISRDTISEFACDGVLMINFESLGGDFSRNLIVRKMRQTKNNEDVHPLEISPAGIKIHTIK